MPTVDSNWKCVIATAPIIILQVIMVAMVTTLQLKKNLSCVKNKQKVINSLLVSLNNNNLIINLLLNTDTVDLHETHTS